MMIRTDFASASKITLAQLHTVLLVSLLCLLALLGYRMTVLDGATSSLAELGNELELSEKARAAYDRVATLANRRDYAEMARRVELLNGLTEAAGYPLTHILARLEQLLPKDVMLNEYVQKEGDDSVHIGVSSSDSLSLTAFVHNLEAEEVFQQVLIVRQSSERAGGSHSYDIRLTLK